MASRTPRLKTEGTNMREGREGVTLLEILIVTVIILLLAAIIVPVVLRSKRGAYVAACTSNLRQASIAWTIYADTHDGIEPESFSQLAATRTNVSVLHCPLDKFEFGANREESRKSGVRISYFMPYPITEYRNALKNADANHGVIACVLHGEGKPGRTIQDPLLDTTGLVLRARLDSSVQRVQVGDICVQGTGPGIAKTRSNWTLFTDAWPGPDPWVPQGSYPCR